jgi:hypothetical protein
LYSLKKGFLKYFFGGAGDQTQALHKLGRFSLTELKASAPQECFCLSLHIAVSVLAPSTLYLYEILDALSIDSAHSYFSGLLVFPNVLSLARHKKKTNGLDCS